MQRDEHGAPDRNVQLVASPRGNCASARSVKTLAASRYSRPAIETATATMTVRVVRLSAAAECCKGAAGASSCLRLNTAASSAPVTSTSAIVQTSSITCHRS
jgi:hypothetical protein